MLALAVFEVDEQRLCHCSRKASIPETSYERALLRQVLGTFLDVPPDHLKFGFGSTHPGSIADVPLFGMLISLPVGVEVSTPRFKTGRASPWPLGSQ